MRLKHIILFLITLMPAAFALGQVSIVNYDPHPSCAARPAEIRVITSLADALSRLDNNPVRLCIQTETSGLNNNPAISDVLTADVKTCSCIRGTGRISDLISQNTLSDSEIASRIAQANLRIQRDNIQVEANASLIQASLLTENEEQKNNIARYYTQVAQQAVGTAATAFAGALSQMRDSRSLTDENRASLASVNVAAVSAASPINLVIQPTTSVPVPEFTENLLTGRDSTSNNCLTLREFVKFRQFDNDKEIYNLITPNAPFNPVDWDYNRLRENFAALTANSTNLNNVSPEARAIYIKMDFLKRNPLVKTFFSAPSTLDAKKADLFHQMGSAFRRDGGNCMSDPAPQSCTHALILASGSNSKETFNAILYNFFTNEQNALAVNNQTQADIEASTRQINSSDGSDFVPSRENIADLMGSEGSLVGSLQCTQTESTEACNIAYAKYCPLLDKLRTKRGNLANELERNWFSAYNADENPLYDEMHRAYCESPIPRNDGGGSEIWHQWKTAYCADPDTAKLCIPANDEIIRRAFWDSHLPVGFPRPPIARSLETENVQVMRTGPRIDPGQLRDEGTYRPRGSGKDNLAEKSGSSENSKSKILASNSRSPIQPARETAAPTYLPLTAPAPEAITGVLPAAISPAVAATQQAIAQVEAQKSSIAEDIAATTTQMNQHNVSDEQRLNLQRELDTLRQQMSAKDQILAQYQTTLNNQIAASRSPAAESPAVSSNGPGAVSPGIAANSVADSSPSAKASVNGGTSGAFGAGNGSSGAPVTLSDFTRTSSGPGRRNETHGYLSKYDQNASLEVSAENPNVLFIADSAENHATSDQVRTNVILPLNVTETEYANIINRNTEAIRLLETQITSIPGSVVQVQLTIANGQRVSFIAYKENGKIILQAPRTHTYRGLLHSVLSN